MIPLLITFILCFTIIVLAYFKFVYHRHEFIQREKIRVFDSRNSTDMPKYHKYIDVCKICGKVKVTTSE